MSLVLDDRVRETTQTTGTGTITLDGAVQGFQSFAVIGNNNTTYYTINRGSEWEVGLGTYYGGTLSRDTVLASSTGSKVNFSAGSKDVFVTYPSEKSVYLNESGKTQFNGNSYQDINPISTPAFQEGRFWYDTDQHLLAFYNDVSSAIVHVGQDTQFRVINSTGSTIPNGSPVYITSTSSGSTSPYIALAKADVAATCAVIGLANGSIAAGATGYVTAQGVIDNVNTGTYTVGQVLYLSPYSAGQLMNTVPPTGIVVQVGTVSYVNSSTGKIFVKQTTPLSISGSTITGAISGVTIDNSIIGATTPVAGTFTTLVGGGGSANYGQITGGATTKAVQFQTLGSDTNVSLAVQSKGTGAIDLAAGSSGVNISNGGTVTALTLTGAGTYTSAPSIAITTPTTAGGVQATASVAVMYFRAVAIQSGGTGYTVGDVLSIVGGTPTGATATATVTTVSSGVITGISVTTGSNYSVLPSNPVSVTGGTGTGATLNLSWGVVSFTISNAGSGYVEQPTVTFSSGSATAYATVGSATTVRTLGSSLLFATPTGGTAFALLDSSSTGAAYWAAIPGTGTPILRAIGTSSGQISTGSATPIQFVTNTSAEQMRVSHTASAVNYVQVTGATTASKVVAISAQGSDTDVTLSLSPKGAGTIRFGTYTAGVLTPTGYVTITDSGGTSRRLLVG